MERRGVTGEAQHGWLESLEQSSLETLDGSCVAWFGSPWNILVGRPWMDHALPGLEQSCWKPLEQSGWGSLDAFSLLDTLDPFFHLTAYCSQTLVRPVDTRSDQQEILVFVVDTH